MRENILKFSIRKNKANSQFNLSPKKTEMPKEILEKMDISKIMKIRWEDIYWE